METKNICGKIPVELHEKVREELEGTEMTIPQFLQKVIEEHFMKKGVEKMEAKTLAVQVSEELFNRLKERVEKEKRQRRGRFTQKDYLIEIITQALDAADELEKQDEDEPELHVTQPEELELENALQWAGWIWRGTAVWDKTNSRPQKGRFRQQTEFIIWGSNGPMPISRPVSCLPGVFRYGNPQNRVHVTEKPLQLMKDVVQICEPGGRILDPFAGAGTTILAAAQQGYQAVGIEVTDAYFQLGTERVREALKEEVDVQ